MLPRSGRLALHLPPSPLPPLAQPHPTTLLELTKRSALEPQTLAFGGWGGWSEVSQQLPNIPVPTHREQEELHKGLCKGRLWQVPPLPVRAETTLLGGHGEPPRGGLAAPRTLPSTSRGHLDDGKTRAMPQELPKPRPGQQLGSVLAHKSVRRLSGICIYPRK